MEVVEDAGVLSLSECVLLELLMRKKLRILWLTWPLEPEPVPEPVPEPEPEPGALAFLEEGIVSDGRGRVEPSASW